MNVMLESPKQIYRVNKLLSVFLFYCFFVEIFISQVHMLCQTSRKRKSREKLAKSFVLSEQLHISRKFSRTNLQRT
jgi:hypothetical protein